LAKKAIKQNIKIEEMLDLNGLAGAKQRLINSYLKMGVILS